MNFHNRGKTVNPSIYIKLFRGKIGISEYFRLGESDTNPDPTLDIDNIRDMRVGFRC